MVPSQLDTHVTHVINLPKLDGHFLIQVSLVYRFLCLLYKLNKTGLTKKKNNNFLSWFQGTQNKSKILSAAFPSASSLHLAAPLVANFDEKNRQASVETNTFQKFPGWCSKTKNAEHLKILF